MKKIDYQRMKESNLIVTLDKWFSRYIRLKNADEFGMVKCITCGRRLHWKSAQCGHYVKRGHRATRFHEKNCGEQCRFCNTRRNGEEQAHRLYINFTYGEGTAEFLKQKGKTPFEMTREEYTEKIEHYRKLVTENSLFQKSAEEQK